MDAIREAGEKLIISVVILGFIVTALSSFIASTSNASIYTGFSTIVIDLETFHFSAEYGFLLLFLSLFLGVFAVYLFEFLVSFIRKEFGGVIYMAQTIKFRNHYIVCGGGRIGERVAANLKERGKKVLIVENQENRAIELKKLGFNVLKENALEEKTYKLANIGKAKAVFAALGQDVDNFLVVLNARSLAHDIRIITRCNSVNNIIKFKELGANEVVLPEIVGADRMIYLLEKKTK
jgi:voltage-gated potassium channel